MSEFKLYRRKGFSEMRPFVKGEDLSKISVSEVDNPNEDMGMVARNPKNHEDQWYVARQYFEDNLEEVPDTEVTYPPVEHASQPTIADSIHRLQAALKTDNEYFYSWQANIAMSFKDLLQYNYISTAAKEPKAVYNRDEIHELANEAAKNFLNQLINHK